jgi:hypothetical protein
MGFQLLLKLKMFGLGTNMLTEVWSALENQDSYCEEDWKVLFRKCGASDDQIAQLLDAMLSEIC